MDLFTLFTTAARGTKVIRIERETANRRTTLEKDAMRGIAHTWSRVAHRTDFQ